ncbi:MAG: aminoacyl-tRNA hydrolase [Smithellaceae bacterium]|nr:aminoacyl-tRNA hydrolase [Smithellaceae bacterium]
MKLIVGLGNPGARYRFSRHNFGFLVLDYLADRHNLPVKKASFNALLGDGRIGDTRIILAKPQTYMNLSGAAVQEISAYSRIDALDIIVVHDDLDLPLGTLRLKIGGGPGGHKGLVSIINRLGTADFIRLRLGIGKPDDRRRMEDYVLEFFSPEEMALVSQVTARAGEAIEETIASGLQAAMAKYHTKAEINSEEV